MLNRELRTEQYRKNPEVSVLIVGAGINGIGVFWDLASQGLDVLLVDRSDYCSGASAATSHMIHGGIRYLENGEFRLVREAVQERNWLIEKAPHLVKPLPTTFPIFKLFSGILNAPLKFLGLLDQPSERGAIVIKFGMMLYDFYTQGKKIVPNHRFLNRDRSLAQFPMLNPDILFTGTYFDGSMLSPERIAVELVQDAIDANKKAIALNYVSLDSIVDSTVTLKDEITGERFSVTPKLVINAGGPWVDYVNSDFGQKTQFMGGTKGSHLVLDHPELRRAIGDHEFFFENKDGRIVLLFPFGERVLVGTSDFHIDDPDDAVITDDEVQYFFEMIKRVFPNLSVDRSHIVFTFSGVRPLPKSNSQRTGQITRDHSIKKLKGVVGSFPVYSLVGGKWTTFRAFAEKMSDMAMQELNLIRNVSTREMEFGGGRNYPKTKENQERWIMDLATRTGLPLTRTEVLFSRYGTRSEEIAVFISSKDDHQLLCYPGYSFNEIEYIVCQEDVAHLDDFLFRRSMIGLSGEITADGLNELAGIIGKSKNWEEDRIQSEIQRVINILKSKHRMNFDQYLVD